MQARGKERRLCVGIMGTVFLLPTAMPAVGDLAPGAEELVQAGGSDIQTPGFSVPSFVYWDGDTLKDLVVGQGSGTQLVRVRVYLNEGTASEPAFSNFFYVQSNGEDLSVTGSG